MPRSRYRFLGTDAPYFMTMTVNHWLPVFTRPETVEIILGSWRHLQAHDGFRLHGYVILENHLHLVAGSPRIGEDSSAAHTGAVHSTISVSWFWCGNGPCRWGGRPGNTALRHAHALAIHDGARRRGGEGDAHGQNGEGD